MSIRVPENILEIKPYVPGKPIEELERELGIAQSIKLASNENPLGASPMALAALRDAIGNLHRYPDGSGHAFIRDLAGHLDCPPGAIVMGNGSDDIIALLANTLLRPGERAVMPQPSFLMYEIAVRSVGAEPVFVPLQSLAIDLDGMRRAVDEKTRLVFLCNPNNPTGTVINGDDFDRFLTALPLDVVVVVDEAYIEFVRDANCLQSKAYWGGGRSDRYLANVLQTLWAGRPAGGVWGHAGRVGRIFESDPAALQCQFTGPGRSPGRSAGSCICGPDASRRARWVGVPVRGSEGYGDTLFPDAVEFLPDRFGPRCGSCFPVHAAARRHRALDEGLRLS
jgi:hypothetical protein